MSLADRPSTMAAPPWQATLRSRLMEQQAEAAVNRDIIDQYRRLAKTARDLKERNRVLLRGGAGSGPSSGDGPSPLLSHLDAQLSSLRAELSTVYRTQASSQTRQLTLSDTLRERDEEVRALREELRELRDVKDTAARKEKAWEERWEMRTKDLETMNDEILSLNVEVSAIAHTNDLLKIDNANLLQRWLDKMNLAAEEMNHDFEKEATEHDDKEPLASSTSKGKSKLADDAASIMAPSVRSTRTITKPKTPSRPRTPEPVDRKGKTPERVPRISVTNTKGKTPDRKTKDFPIGGKT